MSKDSPEDLADKVSQLPPDQALKVMAERLKTPEVMAGINQTVDAISVQRLLVRAGLCTYDDIRATKAEVSKLVIANIVDSARGAEGVRRGVERHRRYIETGVLEAPGLIPGDEEEDADADAQGDG